MSPFYPFRGGGSPNGDNVTFFTVFFYQGFPKKSGPKGPPDFWEE